MRRVTFAGISIGLAFLLSLSAPDARPDEPEPLPGTQPLDWQGDLAARMVAGADQFLLRKTEESVASRAQHWKRDLSSANAYNASVEPNRKRLAHILGVRDARIPFTKIDQHVSLSAPGLALSRKLGIWVTPATWAAFGEVAGTGLMITRTSKDKSIGIVIFIPDADQSPEAAIGVIDGVAPESQIARRLAECGFSVIIPSLIDRTIEPRGGRSKLTSREYLQRPAYELGRTLAGYEVQKVLALVDFFHGNLGPDEVSALGVAGYGEGGLIALYAAALDHRIKAAYVSGAFDSRLDTWREPVDRNVFGLLDVFGGAELASLVAPRSLIIEASRWPEVTILPGDGGAPGRLITPPLDAVRAEFERAQSLVAGLKPDPDFTLVVSGEDGSGPPGSEPALRAFLEAFQPGAEIVPSGEPPKPFAIGEKPETPEQLRQRIRDRQARQVHEIDRHNQQLLAESPYVRDEFMKKLDTSTPEKFAETVEPYRDLFYEEVIGRFDEPMLPPNPRSRKVFDEPKYTGYEVVLDVWPEVFAYGILLIPKEIPEGERRPVVVCQHGLEGRPSDLADPKVDNPAYNQFAIRLAERGFITFSPQNLYIGHDDFRTLQRKANPLKKTLFSIIVPQHQQITDWLKTLPQVDPDRIAFYGLSYGGKSAMRIPPLVKNYCLSICSGDFNEWVWKNASTRSPYSYVWTPEYEIFEFDLGSTFNYAEMAALIAPRPFMVERGHFDGVAPDEMVAHEFAKVRFLYEARLNLPPSSCRIEWFNGPHTIHGVGTFEFLHQHLDWPMTTPPEPLNRR